MDRRKRGMLAVAGGAAAIFFPGALNFGYPGVMGPVWEQMFQVGSGAVGNTMFFLLAALGIFMFSVGRWQEKMGARFMITVGAIICGVNLFTLVYAQNIYMVYLWAFLNGMGTSFIYIPSLTSVQHWFKERRGLVSGIVNLMFGFSAAIMGPVFSMLLEAVGYNSMNILLGLVTLLVGVVAGQFTEMPERVMGMEEEEESPTRESIKVTRSLSISESIRTKSFWFLWSTWALQGAAGIAMVTLSVSFGVSQGFAMGAAVFILTTFNVTNGLSRIATGYISDKIGRNLTMSLTFLAAGIAYFIMPHVNTLAVSALLAAVIGFAFGTLFSVSAPLVSDCFGLKHFGSIFGLVFTAYGFLAGILGPSLGGFILDITDGNFVIVFTYLGAFCIVSSALIKFVVPEVKPAAEDQQENPGKAL